MQTNRFGRVRVRLIVPDALRYVPHAFVLQHGYLVVECAGGADGVGGVGDCLVVHGAAGYSEHAFGASAGDLVASQTQTAIRNG